MPSPPGQKDGEWIGDSYLCVDNHGTIWILNDYETCDIDEQGITHWMPMPKPPAD